MYRNRKFNKNSKTSLKENEDKKRGALNTIDENATMKIQRLEQSSNKGSASKPSDKEPGNLDEMFSSEENIPASQEPTQRYLSQRSMQAGTLCRTQSRSLTQRPPNTYFELVLMKAGVQLDEADNFVLSCDHVAFVSKFREILIKSQNYPENIETFKTGLRDALNAKSKLVQKLLSGCTISIPGEESTYLSQDSMMVNFLIIDFLRQHVLEVVLDKIEEAACGSTALIINNTIPLLPLLLAQLRYVTLSHGDLIYMRIKHIFEQSTDAAKWDIISSSEFIIDSGKHDEFAQMLLGHMPSSKDLFNTNTVQTLTNLCLSPKMQGKIRTKMLAFIKENQCPNRTLPFLIRFILKILNEDNDDCVRALITSLREILIWKTTNNQDVLDKQTQVELFQYIEQGLTRSRRFYDIWQKTIAAMPANQIRSFDFVILLLLINIKEDRALNIENSLRRRIKLEHINVDILKDTKTKFSAILDLYTNTLMQILHDFLRDKQKSVADFAKGSYSILFEIGDSIQKSILKKLLELTCDKSTQNMTNLALELLKDLQRKYTKEVQNWGMLLMPLLDRLSEMSLSQTRLVLELLCSIAYPAPNLSECPVLQDQIDMLVKKQIISRTSTVKKQGIIGSVQLIDSIARIEETYIEMDDLNTTFSTVSDLPDGRGKTAAQYIVRLHSSTMHCPESLALFYDELASVCAASPNERSNAALLDKPFLIWLCELMTYYFQNSFVAEHSPETTSGIQLSHQKCINTIEDTNTEESELPSIAINIAELVLKPAPDASSSILVLAPLFNLVRVLHLQRYEGSLELINALLGCAIILPTFFDDPEAAFCDYDSEQRKKILDIYFHCVNWIRETVSSFTTQRENMIRSKVLIRLSDLIQIEDRIRKLLHAAPADYSPPMCQFITEFVQSTTVKSCCLGRGRPPAGANQKVPKSSNKHNQTESETLVSFNETNIANNTIGGKTNKNLGANKQSFDQMYGPKQIYRQMDSNIMLILREKLVINYPLPIEETGKGIGLLEYRFVLHDLVSKLESVTGVQKYSSEESLQYIAKPLYFMMDLSKFLHAISCNMEVLATALHEKIENAKHVYGHADLFTDDTNYLKVNLGLSLRLLAAYFSWSRFVDTGTVNAELLKESLLALLEPSKCKQFKAKPSNLIARELFQKFHKYDAHILDLKTAVFLYQLLLNFRKLSQDTETVGESVAQKQAHEIRNLCKSFLLRKWYNYEGTMEKGATCNIYLDELVKGFLKNSDFRRQREILRVVLDETKQLGGKDSALKSFPNFKKANFPLLFRGLCEILITSLSGVIVTQSGTDANDKLRIWEKSCELLNMQLGILQALDVPRNFQLFLKYSHMYLKLVLQHGLQIFEQFLRQNPERVSELLKSLQVTTRFLHNLCCHSKALKNTAIVSQIPFLRETVETLVFRVKALLVANKCASVFWMGNLKNKDLHGDELLSQSASLSAAGQESDEEIPDDDVSVDETLLGQDETTRSDNIGDARVNSDRSKSSSRSKCF